MLRVLVNAILNDADDICGAEVRREMCRDELKALFRDDFAAHAVIVRSRKAAHAEQVRMVA